MMRSVADSWVWVRDDGGFAGFVICYAAGKGEVPAGEGVALVEWEVEFMSEVEEWADGDAFEAAAGGFAWADEDVDGFNEVGLFFVQGVQGGEGGAGEMVRAAEEDA